jgi:transcriptional regulator with AAA-type ATPase domain
LVSAYEADRSTEDLEDFWTAVWKAQNPLSIDQFVVDEFVLTQSQDGSRAASRWRGSGKNYGLLGTRADQRPISLTSRKLFGHSAALNVVLEQVRLVAATNSTVLILGRLKCLKNLELKVVDLLHERKGPLIKLFLRNHIDNAGNEPA